MSRNTVLILFLITQILQPYCDCGREVDEDERAGYNYYKTQDPRLTMSPEDFEKMTDRLNDLELEPLFIIHKNRPTAGIKYFLEVLEMVKEVNRRAYILVEGQSGAHRKFHEANDHMDEIFKETTKLLKAVKEFDGSTDDFESFHESCLDKFKELSERLVENKNKLEDAIESIELEEGRVVREINTFNTLTDVLEENIPILADELIVHTGFVKKSEIDDKEAIQRREALTRVPQTEKTRNETIEQLRIYLGLYKELDIILDKLEPYKYYKKEDWIRNDDDGNADEVAKSLNRLLEIEEILDTVKENSNRIYVNDIIDDINEFSLKTEGFKAKLEESMGDIREHVAKNLQLSFENVKEANEELQLLKKKYGDKASKSSDRIEL